MRREEKKIHTFKDGEWVDEGETLTVYTAQNDEDVRELERLEREGEVMPHQYDGFSELLAEAPEEERPVD